jgi:hypothetical protein
MKKNAFFLLVLFITGCSSQLSNASKDIDSSQITIDTVAKVNARSEQFLTIHGKDIWVRDWSSTGAVVMTLNAGDRCRVVQRGKFERIGRDGDFWYQIEFQGKQGWVFGSQTDWKMEPFFFYGSWCGDIYVPHPLNLKGNPIQGATPELAWNSLRARMQAICAVGEAITDEDKERFSAISMEGEFFGNGSRDFSFVAGCVDGYDKFDFHFKLDTLHHIWLTPVDLVDGSGTFRSMTLLWGQYDSWEFSSLLAGEAVDRVRLEDGRYLFAFRAKRWTPLAGADRLMVYVLEPHWQDLGLLSEMDLGPWSAEVEDMPKELVSIKLLVRQSRWGVSIQRKGEAALFRWWDSSKDRWEP